MNSIEIKVDGRNPGWLPPGCASTCSPIFTVFQRSWACPAVAVIDIGLSKKTFRPDRHIRFNGPVVQTLHPCMTYIPLPVGGGDVSNTGTSLFVSDLQSVRKFPIECKFYELLLLTGMLGDLFIGGSIS